LCLIGGNDLLFESRTSFHKLHMNLVAKEIEKYYYLLFSINYIL